MRNAPLFPGVDHASINGLPPKMLGGDSQFFLSRARASRIRLPETYTASPQKEKKVLLTSNVQRSSVNSPSQEVRLAIAVNLTEVVRRYALSFELYTIADFSHPSVI